MRTFGATEELQENAAALHSGSRLGRDGETAPIDGFKDFVTPTAEQNVSDCVPELFGIVQIAIARFAQQFRAVGIGDNSFEMQDPSG
jgi:hypothetical protein